jgi:hypothetical protein
MKISRKDRLRAATAMLRALLDEGDAAQGRGVSAAEALRIFDGAHQIAEWAKTYMPHLCRNQKTGEAVEFADIHYELYAALLYHKRVLAVLPRGFGKSTVCTLIYPLYLVCEKKARYIMLGSFADHNAKKFLRMVREELETNARIKAAYGDLKGIDEKWTDELFITADNVMVEAIYFGKAAVRGSRHGAVRPEVVILDDLETKEEARNPERVEQLLNWIQDEITKLFFDVQVVIVGTILADGSAIHQLMEVSEGAVTDDAVGDAAAKNRFRLVSVEACDENFGSLAWPWYFSEDVLRAMYEESADAFNQEMRHLPRSRKNRPFHTFHYYVPKDIEAHSFRIVSYFDLIPGIAEGRTRKGDTDFYARIFLAKDLLTKKLLVFSAYRARDLSKADMARDALESYRTFSEFDPGLRLGGEANGFQVWFIDELREIGREIGLYPPVDAIKAAGDKVDRITSMDHNVNTGVILFLRDDPYQKVLVEELKRIGSRFHDDLADCLSGCMIQIRSGAGAPISAERCLTGRGALAAFFRGSDGSDKPDKSDRSEREARYARAANDRTGAW